MQMDTTDKITELFLYMQAASATIPALFVLVPKKKSKN